MKKQVWLGQVTSKGLKEEILERLQHSLQEKYHHINNIKDILLPPIMAGDVELRLSAPGPTPFSRHEYLVLINIDIPEDTTPEEFMKFLQSKITIPPEFAGDPNVKASDFIQYFPEEHEKLSKEIDSGYYPTVVDCHKGDMSGIHSLSGFPNLLEKALGCEESCDSCSGRQEEETGMEIDLDDLDISDREPFIN